MIIEALDTLPPQLGDDLRAKAETLLVQEAAKLGPRELKVFGSRLLDYLAHDIADEPEYQRLLDQQRRASAATRLSLRSRGDGSTDIHARVPDHAAGRLHAYVNAYTASCSAPSITTEPTTPAGSPTTTPTARPASTDARDGARTVLLTQRLKGS